MVIDCIKSPSNFFNKFYQCFPFRSSLIYYILSHAPLPTQIKLSQTCKEFHEKLYKRHNYQVDELWLNRQKSTYRIYNKNVYLYPTSQFLLQLQHPLIVTKTILLFNINDKEIENVLAKLEYSTVKEMYFSCCTVDFETVKNVLMIPTLKLISYWSSNVINASKTDIDDYVFENYPNVYVNDPD
uniref:F-box domain-containing protein n=1 Tax=Panagrolaimus davidi TaxID=227884 RepID=A0A914QNX2_9BILA